MTNGQPSHDAQKTLADLRDHLARHDKPIAFFFGAGTSCSITVPVAGGKTQPVVPAVPGLTAACKKDCGELGEKFAKAWASIEAHCEEAKLDPHIENVLSRLRMMLNAIGKDDTLCGLKVDELDKLEECVRKTIARIVTPELKILPEDFAHRKLARWIAKTSRKCCVEIFTVNYDVLIEHALESERVPVFDGFVGSYQPFFHPDSVRRAETAPGANWTRLWKMHGSVTWQRIEQDGRSRVVRGAIDPAGEMIMPSFQKYDESRQQPYAAFTDRLTRFLEQDDALLIAAGFNFGDEHINNLIFGALENRPRTHVYALQFEELADDSVLIKRAYQRSNLIVVGPHTGVIGGRRSKWAPNEIPSFMDGVFELKSEAVAAGGDASKVPKSGVMKIGDFACFCRFLESMAN
ncbi:MAG TPA: SIR2 family protein [Pseudolabrys sp.]|uniref:SIR2 family protein n=1 Tax=Pseudolabrys sp. TaxID=1960880 RepID=UPI002DDD1930|nr:SIR2 family protein [Pseudolabrys sp.]HEV2630511.1 SIR2 family protein [Pseudolabrys sp.]